jgi:uncharacterized protein YcaQ
MWLSGELMMHHRNGFDRVYDFRENIAPKKFDYIAKEEDALEFFARKAVAFMGLKNQNRMSVELNYYMHARYAPIAMKKMMDRQKALGVFEQVQIEGKREVYLALAEDLPILETLQKGKIPKSWNPKDTTTLEEVTLLASLDIVSARGRAMQLFDFDYKWEVYVPAEKRRWGYYVLPILYGDDLVARLDPKLDRTTMTLEIKGFWLEEDAPVKEIDFANALGKGIARFANFVGAKKVNLAVIKPAALRTHIQKIIGEDLKR